MEKTSEQYALNVKTLQQFRATFEQIKKEITFIDPWTGMGTALSACAKDVQPGDVVKAVGRSGTISAYTDHKVIVIGTSAGPLALFEITLGSSTGIPTVEERTLIQPHIPSGLYPLINNRIARPIEPDDLAWLVNPQIPEADNIGQSLLHFTSGIIPVKLCKQSEF